MGPLIDALRDGAEYIREDISRILVKIGEPAVVSLIYALKDRNEYVRDGVADALVRIGSSVVEPLIRAMRDKNEQKNENKMFPNA